MTRAYILTTRYVDGNFFLFCLDEESNPITLCIAEHFTYLLAKSKKQLDCSAKELAGEQIAIKLELDSASVELVKPIEMLRLNDSQAFTSVPIPYYKIYLKSYKELGKAKRILNQKGYAIAEYPSEESKLFSDLKMKPCQWIEFDDDKTVDIVIQEHETYRPRRQLAIRSSDLKSCSVQDIPPPKALEATFDTETYSPRYGINGSLAMPDPIVEDNILYCLSIILTWSDSDLPIKTICICVSERDIFSQAEDQEIIVVKSEADLYKQFFNLIRFYDPEIILGHNSSSYDFGYIAKRTSALELPQLGRLESFEEEIELNGKEYLIKLDLPISETYEKKSWEGAGGTWHDYTIPSCYGRIILDTLIILQKLKTSPGTPGALQSHSLKSLGLFLVGEDKADMSYAETFYAYRSKEPQQIARICDYCIQDSRLCMKIFHKTKSWIAVRESSAIFLQDANQVIITGQTLKSYTIFLRVGEEMGFAFHKIDHKQVKVKGGSVEKPVKGKHTNVIVFDFASMYPTAQRAFNICSSTYSKIPPAGCNPDEYVELRIPVEVGIEELPASYEEYEGLDGEEIDPSRIEDSSYIDALIKWNHFNPDYKNSFIQMLRRDLGLPVTESFQTMVVYFVKASKRKGVLPSIQESLSEARGMYKRQMKDAEKKGAMIEKEMFDQRQQLVKVVMNSIYGCLGASVGRMSFPEGAAAITFIGRTHIAKVRSFLVEKGCKIIYGDTDSLMFQHPSLVPQVESNQSNGEMPQSQTNLTQPLAPTLLNAPISEETIAIGHKLVEEINRTLPAPMAMEFEKVLNAVFIDKKRYVGFKTWPKREMFTTGVSAVRGDTTPFGRKIYTTILGAILEDKSKSEVDVILNEELVKLMTGQIPNEMLAVSKMLAHSYASPSAPMNVYAKYLISIGELAEAGTKIPLIVTKQLNAKSKAQCYRLPTTTEQVDYDYYAEMAKRPLEKLLEATFLSA